MSKLIKYSWSYSLNEVCSTRGGIGRVLLHLDNNWGTIALAGNPSDYPQTKYIVFHYHFIFFAISNNTVLLKYVSTLEMATIRLWINTLDNKEYIIKVSFWTNTTDWDNSTIFWDDWTNLSEDYSITTEKLTQ